MSEYSERLEDLLDHHLISNEELQKKKELGGVGYLINGNMCLGVFDDLLFARIGEELAQSLIVRDGIEPYQPEEDEYNDFVLIEKKIYNHRKALAKFIDRSISYTRQLPPKEHDEEKWEK